jgi:uncharacterized protein (DUF1684 family)
MEYYALLKKTFFFILALLVFHGCTHKPDISQEYITKVLNGRTEKNAFMKDSPDSPFGRDTNAVYEPLKYYDFNKEFVFSSKLYEYDNKEQVTIYGTKGEERKVLRFGYVLIDYKDKEYKVSVYKGTSRSGSEYFSIWFTDKTTGKETYRVGRYLDFEYVNDKDHMYTIDFNLAYNPYCAYSAEYSCAIPSKDDYLDIAVNAGEKTFSH